MKSSGTKGTICFDISKNELFLLIDNYRTMHRKLKANWKVEQNEAELTKEKLSSVDIFIVPGPQDKFTEDEFKVLKEFVGSGGKLVVLLGEGGEISFNTNINFFLEEYGMSINSDTVVRPHYYKNFHPKECVIGGGIACESMYRNLLLMAIEKIDYNFTDEKFKIHFQYPFGATLNVVDPSNILLTTGPVVYPFNRPLAGYYCNDQGGKILTVGSGHMFLDKYLNDKTNEAIFEYFINLLGGDEIKFTHLDFNDIEVNDNKIITDTSFIADQPKPCLVESTVFDVPADFKKLFITKLHSLNNDLLREVIDTYQKLNVKYEPLKIIKPQFEIPLPPLQLAVFPPVFSDLPPPNLELFDLDEAFSTPRSQIMQLSSKCFAAANSKEQKRPVNEKDLEYYIRECGRIVGVYPEGQEMTARDIIFTAGVKIAQYKRLDHE